ncbi:MAG: endonuclease [Candidatus Cloacimonadaceae bacterium]|nr:endonuclease [Candidatus Cloacimonadaceae bacterium]
MIKKMMLFVFVLMTATIIGGQYIVNFEGAGETKLAYASGTVNLSGIDWNLTETLIGTDAADWKNGLRSTRLRGYAASAISMLANKANGLGTLSFQYRRYGTDVQVDWKVEYSTDNGLTWLQAGEVFTAPATDDVQTFSEELNLSGSVRIRIKRATDSGSSNRRLNIDDITLTDFVPADPAIILNPSILSGFAYVLGQGPSLAQQYQLSAMNLNPLSGNVNVSGSASFEVSPDGNTWSNAYSLPYSGGAVTPTTLYTRMKAGLPAGQYSTENITHSGGGTSTLLGVSGNVSAPVIPMDSNGYQENFATFLSMNTMPFGWTLSDTYVYGGDFGMGSTGGLRGNGTFGIQLTSSAPNNNLTATLRLQNQTGGTITSLNFSYMGRVARIDQTGTPKWIVTVNGTVIPELEYDTADGINALRSTVITGLNIAPAEIITIAWFTTSTGTTGTRRQIGITDIDINTTFIANPQIILSGTLTSFQTTQGIPSAAQSYTLTGIDLSNDILITMPSGFELSYNGGASYQSSASLPFDFAGQILVRMMGNLAGTFGGNIVHTSVGALSQNLGVAGTVIGPTNYATDLFFSEYIEGSSNNKALEIFNGTGNTIDLSLYKVELYSNGASTPNNTETLTGTLAHGAVYVIANSAAAQEILNLADITSSVTFFNGDDALAIRKVADNSFVDIFGVIGNDPGTAWTGDGGYTTLDRTLVRKPEVSVGVSVNPSGTGASAFSTLTTEWDVYPQDTFSYLGNHEFSGGGGVVERPTIQASNIIIYPANTEITLEWTPGNGARRVVKINNTNSFSAPSDGSNPSANTVYSGSGEQVIFNGATQIIEDAPFNGCSVSNLMPNTTYWFRIYEYNGSGAYTLYNVNTAANNPNSGTTTNSQGTGYYAGISGFGATLKTNLHLLLRTTHTTRYSYDALWTQLPYTDEDPNNSNNIIEIYTGWSVPKTHSGGGTTQWNREHTWSQSHGDLGDSPPGGTDLHHMRPCDSTVNSAKGNKDFDNGGTPYIDSSPYPGYSGDTGCFTSTYSWEPRNEDKGDVARMIMYMAVRYEGTDTSYNLEIVDHTNSSGPNYGKLSTLLSWHVQDPPDARELQRNERIFERQGNRNPFIDNPIYAQYVWSPIPLNPTNVTQTSFTANWSVPISASKYYLQVATDSLFTAFVTGYANYDALLTTSKVVSGLSNANTYYYRLRSYFTSGYSMYSPFQRVSLYAPAVTATITPSTPLNEYNLDGALITITLSNTSFTDNVLLSGNFTLNNAPAGLSVQSVQYLSPTSAIITLAFNGADFDDNIASFGITINAVEINYSAHLISSSIPIIAYVEMLAMISVTGTDLVIDIPAVAGAVSYWIFSSTDPYGQFTDFTAQGSFAPAEPTRWSMPLSNETRRFFMAAAMRN